LVAGRVHEAHVRLLDLLRSSGLEPTRRLGRVDGTVAMTWYADDDENRFVMAFSSPRDDTFTLLCRDGSSAEAAVLLTADEVRDWVADHLVGLGKTSRNQVVVEETGRWEERRRLEHMKRRET